MLEITKQFIWNVHRPNHLIISLVLTHYLLNYHDIQQF